MKHPWQIGNAPIAERQSFVSRQPKEKTRLEKIAAVARHLQRIRELGTDSGVRGDE